MRSRAFPFLALVAAFLGGCRESKGQSPSLLAADSAAPAPSTSSETAALAESGEAEVPPAPTGPSLVDLSGNAHLPPPTANDGPRLASIAMRTDVLAKPDPNAKRVGYLRAGAIVEMEPEVVGTARLQARVSKNQAVWLCVHWT